MSGSPEEAPWARLPGFLATQSLGGIGPLLPINPLFAAPQAAGSRSLWPQLSLPLLSQQEVTNVQFSGASSTQAAGSPSALDLGTRCLFLPLVASQLHGLEMLPLLSPSGAALKITWVS